MGHRIFLFFGHSRPTHTSLPPFLDPLNSFPWSLFADFSPFERYDENKFGRLLDRVFRPPQQRLDQGKGTDVFMVSYAFRLYKVCKFWTSFGYFSIFVSFRVITENVWTEIGQQLVKLGKIEVGLVKLDIFMSHWKVQFQKISLRVKSPNFGYRVYRAHYIIGHVGVQFR